MNNLIDGKLIAQKITDETAKKVKLLRKKGIIPKLVVVLVGDDPASEVYVRQKAKAAQNAGIDFDLARFKTNISRQNFIEELIKIQNDRQPSGLIIQLPLPEKLYCPEVLNSISSDVDVDFLSENSLGKLMTKNIFFEPPTPGAIMTILRELNVNLVGKNVTIVGMGTLVGKPLAVMMVNERASITTCNSATKNIKEKCLQADILVSCVGKKGLIQSDMVKPGAIVIDAGFTFQDGKAWGDVELESVGLKAQYVTPTPGGVGPITVALLLKNVVIYAERKAFIVIARNRRPPVGGRR